MSDLNLSAYYYGFKETGVRPIDKILEAVARAGNSYHHTEDWGGPAWGGGLSEAAKIQQAANKAAEAFKDLQDKAKYY